ncbi:MAG: S-methyl-5'-thioadenosine phosphorylase [Elusimicrobia bacterium]|nr:S-methyl-5'-thioadenosine phosphorylase [Elusimicrobiota bacterium]
MEQVKIAVIGGSGLYEMDGLEKKEEVEISTPFGKPSDSVICGELEGVRIAFLPRHGRGHRILPAEVNSRANIYALKTLGVERIISVSACGSLKEEYRPCDILIPDQIFDNTKLRGRNTFFGNGIAAHIQFADPFCPELSRLLFDAVSKTGTTVHRGGTFVVIEGPRFSTRAESNFYRSISADVVGMTAMPEAVLAREAEICYATMAHITDYDIWKENEEVSVERVVANLNRNTSVAKDAIRNVVKNLGERKCSCGTALKNAIMTSPDLVPDEVKKKLSAIAGKYIKGNAKG